MFTWLLGVDLFTVTIACFVFRGVYILFENTFKYIHEIQKIRITRQSNFLCPLLSNFVSTVYLKFGTNGRTLSPNELYLKKKPRIIAHLLASYADNIRCSSTFDTYCRWYSKDKISVCMETKFVFYLHPLVLSTQTNFRCLFILSIAFSISFPSTC